MTARRDVVARSGVRVRIGPWRGSADVAEVAVQPSGGLVPVEVLEDAVRAARDRGFTRAVTPALARHEWRPHLDAGFAERERLHLLAHDLLDLEDRPRIALRRVPRRRRADVLRIDHAAFSDFWQLDPTALDDAVRATPSVRFRITADGAGYVLVGRAGDRGYLQRLAVDPAAQGRGTGRALVLDGLWWLRRRRAHEVLVNTQEANDRAMALYRSLGFRPRPEGLAVFEIDLRTVAPRG